MVDYSKWKKIEISDDEDDTHPNIDTPSLFRWRHQARQERDYKLKSEMQSLEERKKAAASLSAEDSAKLKEELAEIAKKEQELERQARLRPYNVDSIGKESWESTCINSVAGKAHTKSAKEYTDEDFQDFEKFVQNYEQDLKDYSFLNGVSGSRRYILEHSHLVSQFTVDWLIMRCVDYKINGSIALMKHVAYQAVIIEMMLDISKSVGRGCDPRNCLPIFFERYKNNVKLIDGVIDEQVATFLERVDKGAEYRIEQAYEKQQESEEPIVGPGGLDPNEVFQELEPELQDAFLDRDLEKLRAAIQKYSPEEGEAILNRCVDAGLWMNSVNSDLEEYAQSYEKEQQRVAALSAELEPEVLKPEAEIVQEEIEDFDVRDVFSKLIINPNREVKKQPGFFQDDDDKKETSEDDKSHIEEVINDETVSLSNEYYESGEEMEEEEAGVEEKNYRDYEFDMDQFEGRTLTEEETNIRDQLLAMAKKCEAEKLEEKLEASESYSSVISELSDSVE